MTNLCKTIIAHKFEGSKLYIFECGWLHFNTPMTCCSFFQSNPDGILGDCVFSDRWLDCTCKKAHLDSLKKIGLTDDEINKIDVGGFDD